MTASENTIVDGTNLSSRQEAIWRVLHSHIKQAGYPPSIRELAQEVGLASPSSVKHQLDILTKLGYIRRVPNQPRALEILISPDGEAPLLESSPSPAEIADLSTEQKVEDVALDLSEAFLPEDMITVPLVGRIAAGVPITAEQAVEDTFLLPQQLTGQGDLFMLSVSGDSMIDAAICDGDWVVVRRQNVAEQGEIVAAMLDGEATVKVWSQRNGHAWLLPRNSNYAPIPADHCTILGKIVSVLRAL
ncbi:transcriptional repressor LexA [Boudabousia marimammalium]|uniref:LexA repressor n=1 Tax=Boudabousia marimammalium TaxID=156892 RepID=A0A1Q5PP21_9ACTO|nr:transcriptional repressor LexA [Boudabousia marimammalium]OKL49256.1 repressor LexA [Boudabousia marimammalium]